MKSLPIELYDRLNLMFVSDACQISTSFMSAPPGRPEGPMRPLCVGSERGVAVAHLDPLIVAPGAQGSLRCWQRSRSGGTHVVPAVGYT
ncbi:MAG: hypothetical protein IT521_14250 [Burkholderiales bacterium]|nr:hypothetical protein [Burkholderiales bacterium]